MKHKRPTAKELNDMIYATLQIQKFWYKGLGSLSKEEQKKLNRDIQNIRQLLSDIEIEEKSKKSNKDK
ncbi:MAG: hypothetical protein ACR2M6_02655 [Vampirovibrionia bacterium]